MIYTFLLGFLFFSNPQIQQEVPLLSMDAFEYILDYSFKNKHAPESNTVQMDSNPVYQTHPLPYVKLEFIIDGNKLEFSRYKIIDNFNKTVRSRRVKGLEQISLDLGYAADIKDRITAHSYTIIFYDENKTSIAKILINFSKEGDMYINEKLLGRI